MRTKALFLLVVGIAVAEDTSPSHVNNHSTQSSSEEIAELGTNFSLNHYDTPENSSETHPLYNSKTEHEQIDRRVRHDKITSDSIQVEPQSHVTHGTRHISYNPHSAHHTSHPKHEVENVSPAHHVVGRKGVSPILDRFGNQYTLMPIDVLQDHAHTREETIGSVGDWNQRGEVNEEIDSHELDSRYRHSHVHEGVENKSPPSFGQHFRELFQPREYRNAHQQFHGRFYHVIPEHLSGEFGRLGVTHVKDETVFHRHPFSGSEDKGNDELYAFSNEYCGSDEDSSSEEESSQERPHYDLRFEFNDAGEAHPEIIIYREITSRHPELRSYGFTKQNHHVDKNPHSHGLSYGSRKFSGQSVFNKMRPQNNPSSSPGRLERHLDESHEHNLHETFD